MNKSYNPKDFEEKIYKEWLERKYFKASINKDKKPFTLVSPPPNITSKLHVGHAFNLTLQDIIIRYKRMLGYEVLWVQGTDHAAIATEVKVCEKLLKEEGKTKYDIGRQEFSKRIKDWYDNYNGVILNQFVKMGISPDWDRKAFTMDDKCSRLVRETFVNLYNKGLIYKGDRIINWCPHCKTAISDAEIEYEENQGHLWHIKYPLKDNQNEYLVVATTRPETLFGDTAVAVNPNDERYANLIGKEVIIPVCNRAIKIIADDYVETEFGTGVVKITPAHDPNDFEVGQRHNLEIIKVMNDDGTMNSYAGEFNGLDRRECRKKLIEKLEELNLLFKTENYQNNVGHCYRCHNVCEPIISKQWFLKMEDLVKPALQAVEDKELNFYPERVVKIYNHWLTNIKDWCISRQLWSGHQIPVYTCQKCGNMWASVDKPCKCEKCSSDEIMQETDVLDTWFSSALWPISVLNGKEELDYFYPCDINITAYDIIFFWVARMVFMCNEITGKIPFKDVLMHGLIRDMQGRKMSKSLGNGIDPIDVIEKYGTDATRLSLVTNVTVGGDSRYGEEKAENASQFINKMWNASKFVLMSIENVEIKPLEKCNLSYADKWFLTKFNDFVINFNVQMEKYEFGLCANMLQEFFWGTFCDFYLELTKPNLQVNAQDTASVLYFALTKLLTLFHPFIPFVTEEIYREVAKQDTIMFNEMPTSILQANQEFEKEYKFMEDVISSIKSIRNARINMKIPDNKKSTIFILAKDKDMFNEECATYIEKLAFGKGFKFILSSADLNEECIEVDTVLGKIYLSSNDLIDSEKEIERLRKEIETVKKEIQRGEKLLSNQGFVAKAPASLIGAEKTKLEKYKNLLIELEQSLDKKN
ncbi:MAG: valine--tRNA ligase [Clostridia bacterium]|nr:valine--tRNA ligase [Clostridia bacterium]